MKFPGSKLLHHWDLATQHVSLDDVLRSCQQVGLTGLAEVKFPQAVAMIFYYLGGEVNALYREGSVAYHGAAALERLRARVQGDDGEISVYELPLDMAHLLRGITNRQKLKETVRGRAALVDLLHQFEKAEHTGTVEMQLASGAAMVLVVRGRISNTYWETSNGLTYEKGEARQRLEQALDKEEAQIFSSEFSREVWKSRHEVQSELRSRLEMRPSAGMPPPTEQLAAEEHSQRQQVLEDIQQQVPALIQVFLFDLMTGAVLARRGGTTGVKVSVMAERMPAMTSYIRDLVASEDGDTMDVVEISTERMAVLVALVDETQEAIALFADKSQPTALLSAALTRSVRAYAARLAPRAPAGASRY